MIRWIFIVALVAAAGDDGKPVPRPPVSSRDDPCHGPYNKRLFRKDKENRARERAEKDVREFFNRVGQVVETSRKQELEGVRESKRRRFVECLKENRRPSILCTVMASRDAGLCGELVAEQDRETCSLLLSLARAGRKESTRPCSLLTNETVRKLCGFLATRRFDCAALGSPELEPACVAIEALLGAGEPPAGLDDFARTAVYWLVPMITGEKALCDRVPSAREADGCRAAVTGNAGVCPAVRPTLEHLDGDYSCREMILYRAVHSTSYGKELVLQVGSSFPGRAECVVRLHLTYRGQRLVRKLADVTFEPEKSWVELRHQVVGEEVGRAEVECNWEPQSSRFVVPGEDQANW